MPSHLRARPREIAYALRLARVRQSAFNFLQDGTLLAPPLVETEEEEIPMSRLSIYAGQQEALKEFMQRVPLTLASVWRALDGKIGIAVTSIADRPLTPTLTLDLADMACGGAAGFTLSTRWAERPWASSTEKPWC